MHTLSICHVPIRSAIVEFTFEVNDCWTELARTHQAEYEEAVPGGWLCSEGVAEGDVGAVQCSENEWLRCWQPGGRWRGLVTHF